MSDLGRGPSFQINLSTVPARVPGGCYYCGRGPAAEVDYMSVTGLLIPWQQSRFVERLCHDCGLAEARDTLAHNASIGWWSPVAFVLNVRALVSNHRSTRAVRALPPPAPPAPPGALPPGRVPALLRPRFLMALAAVAGVAGFVLFVPDEVDIDELVAGQCVITPEEGDTRVGVVECDDPHDAEVVLVDDAAFIGAYSAAAKDQSVRPEEVISARCSKAVADYVRPAGHPPLRTDIFSIDNSYGISTTLVCLVSATDGRDLTGSVGF